MCLCRKCSNGKFHVCDTVREHLYRFGFTPNYYNWTYHDEQFISDEGYRRSGQFLVREECSYYDQLNPYERMVIDAAGQNFVSESNHASTSFTLTLEQVGTSHASQLEEIGVTGFDENVCNETFLYNQF